MATISQQWGGRFRVLRNRPLLTLMLGHFTVDMYVGLLPVLYPVLTSHFKLNLQTVGLVTLAYSGMASITQPFFGWIADRYGTRFIGLALIWTGSFFSTIGFASSFPLLLALAGIAGIGSGIYHPLGAVNASAVIPDEQRNTAMSIYVTGGTIGVALGPLIGAIIFTQFGLHGTICMLLPGFLSALWLLSEMRTVALPRRRASRSATPQEYPPIAFGPLFVVIGVMMMRSWTILSIEAFIPSWYKSLGYGPAFYGPLATSVVLSTAVGCIGAGSLANRYGRRAVTIGSLILTLPAILVLAQFTGPIAFVTATVTGFLAASTGPLMLVMAQQLMARRAGMASGFVLGLGFVAAAIGVPITGGFADVIGFPATMRLLDVVVLVTIGIAWFLPREGFMRGLANQTRATPAAPTGTRPLVLADKS